MAGFDDVVSQIRNTLALSDPDLDTSIGTTTRKIIDAVAESISEAYVDSHVLDYTYDIDSKTGGDLDDFTQTVGGITRYAAKRATGMVTFSRPSSAANTLVAIPINTVVSDPNDFNSDVFTVTTAFLAPSQTSVSVPVTAVQPGPQGNIAAGRLTQIKTPLSGTASVTNPNSLSGGTDVETDSALRTRWKKTVFRSLAGTTDMYLSIALDDGQQNGGLGCYAANVVGASARHREQVQIVSGTATSQLTDAYYIYPDGSMLGVDIDNGLVLVEGRDYQFDYTKNPPVMNMLAASYDSGGGVMLPTEGEIFELDFEYVPMASRNLPSSGITNRVDVYCAGTRPGASTQSIVYQTSLRFTSSDQSSRYYTGRFIRDSGVHPTDNNVFIPLAFGPLLSLPSTISVSGNTYTLNTDYWMVHEDIPFGFTSKSLFGIEWLAASIPPGTNPVFSITYNYNEVPGAVQDLIDRWRLAGTDAKAHQAKQRSLKFNLAIMYDMSFTKTTVNAAIQTALTNYLTSLGFSGTLQVSDVLNVIHNVAGVDNVRFLNASDVSGYTYATRNNFAIAIQLINNGTVLDTYCDSTSGRPVDIVFSDAEIPVFGSLNTVAKAQNSFGVA